MEQSLNTYTPIELIDFDYRIIHILKWHWIDIIEDVLRYSELELMEIWITEELKYNIEIRLKERWLSIWKKYDKWNNKKMRDKT